VVSFAWLKPEKSKLVVAITTVMVIVVAAFMALALRTLVTPTLPQDQQLNYLIALGGGAVLVVAIILLVSYGWSETTARTGLLLGVGLVLLAGMVSVSVNSTGIGSETPFELWHLDEGVVMPEWVQVTIDRTLVWNAHRSQSIELLVLELDTPGLRWALHRYEPLEFLPFLPQQSQPGILLTPMGTIPEISHGYQGQSLVWMRSVPWRELAPSQYLTWLITREVPTIPQALILWVRTDLMPGGEIVQ
jgi:type III secretory pathway component EscS